MSNDGFNLGLSPVPLGDLESLAHTCVTLGYKTVALRGGITLKDDEYFHTLKNALTKAVSTRGGTSLGWRPPRNTDAPSVTTHSSEQIRILHRVDHRLDSYGKLLAFLEASTTQCADIVALHVGMANPAFLSFEDAAQEMVDERESEAEQRGVERGVPSNGIEGYVEHSKKRSRHTDKNSEVSLLKEVSATALATTVISKIRSNQILLINVDSLVIPPTSETARYFKRDAVVEGVTRRNAAAGGNRSRFLGALPSADAFAMAKPLVKLSQLALEVSYGLWLQHHYVGSGQLQGVAAVSTDRRQQGVALGVSAAYHARLLSLTTSVVRRIQKPIVLSSGDCGESASTASTIDQSSLPSPAMCLRPATGIYALFATLMQLSNQRGRHPLEEGISLIRKATGFSKTKAKGTATCLGQKRSRSAPFRQQ